jgi:hypothetical protein
VYFYNLEEELIAMRAVEGNAETTNEQKDQARATVLDRILGQGSANIVADDWKDLREKLELSDMSMALFKSCLWHLAQGDRDHSHKRYIKVIGGDGIDHDRMSGRRGCIVRIL